MRKTARPMAIVLCLLTSGACAHDGMLAPVSAPGPEAAPAARSTMLRICGRRFGPPSGMPLYVVDGVMLDAVPETLDPRDVDRIDVVRGAAAVRMFGQRAEHGLVLITTRPRQAPSRS